MAKYLQCSSCDTTTKEVKRITTTCHNQLVYIMRQGLNAMLQSWEQGYQPKSFAMLWSVSHFNRYAFDV